jgi:23S rRNA pseudouridine1911/1915/1917 synthase
MTVATKGKPATSEYEVVKEYPGYSYIKVKLFTGRTHQIRVQFAHLGHPVVGDPMYGKKPLPLGLERQFLHSSLLGITLPSGPYQEFSAPLALDLENFLRSL